MVIQKQIINQGRNRNRGVQRLAFSMIELIFAIVIIGICMLALPMIMLTDASSQEGALAQEGILLTTTKVAQTLTFPWDPNSSPGGELMSTSRVLETRAAQPAGLARVGTKDFRIGHFPEMLRRRLSPNSSPATASIIGAGNNSISSLDGDSENIVATAGSEQFAYKKQWELNTTILYVADAATYQNSVINDFDFSRTDAGPTPTNIKMVQITATDITPNSAGNGNRMRLWSFSSNIGEAEFFKRRY